MKRAILVMIASLSSVAALAMPPCYTEADAAADAIAHVNSRLVHYRWYNSAHNVILKAPTLKSPTGAWRISLVGAGDYSETPDNPTFDVQFLYLPEATQRCMITDVKLVKN